MKKKSLFIILFLLAAPGLFSQSFEYEPFFSVKIIDNENSEFFLSQMRYFDRERELKYFFWIRRGSELGTATYQLDFKKIHFIEFTGEYDETIADYTEAKITLTSGEVFDVLVNTTGSIGGMDRDFGVYGEIYMNYNIVKTIEFVHEGTYKRCPFCGALFYESELSECPFDKTPLEKQNEIVE